MSSAPSRKRSGGQAGLAVDPARLPSLSAIRAFEAAARFGSFAKAAEELDTSAASVSYHVRRLEQELGLRLFLRYSQHVELTVSGELAADEIMQAFALLRAGLGKACDADASRLALTTLPSFGSAWLTPRLGRFRARHPHITLEIDLSETAQDLIESRFDAAIRNGHGRWPGLRTVQLFPSLFMPLCAPALTAAAKNVANPDSRLDVPLLGRQDWWTLWYKARGYGDVTLAGRFGTSLPVEHLDIAAAIARQGVAIGSPVLFHDEIEAGRLVPAHDFVAGDGRSFWLAYPAVRESRPKIAQFREWLCDEASEALRHADRYVRRGARTCVT